MKIGEGQGVSQKFELVLQTWQSLSGVTGDNKFYFSRIKPLCIHTIRPSENCAAENFLIIISNIVTCSPGFYTMRKVLNYFLRIKIASFNIGERLLDRHILICTVIGTALFGQCTRNLVPASIICLTNQRFAHARKHPIESRLIELP